MRAVTHIRTTFTNLPATSLLMGSILSVQVGAALAKRLFHEIGPGGTVFLRVFLASLVLVAIWRPKLAQYSWAQYRLALLFGITFAGMNFAFYSAIARIPLGIAVTVEFIGPLGVAVVGSRRPLDFAWGILAAIGVLLLAPWTGATIDPLGIVLALVAGGCWACYIVLGARTGRSFTGGSGLALALSIGAVILAPIGIAEAGSTLLQPSVLLMGFGVALLSSAIPYSLEIEALRRISPQLFGIFMSIEPAMAAIIGFLILGETLAPRALIAIVLVTLASIGATRPRHA